MKRSFPYRYYKWDFKKGDPIYDRLLEKRKAERKMASANRAMQRALDENEKAVRALCVADDAYWVVYDEWRQMVREARMMIQCSSDENSMEAVK